MAFNLSEEQILKTEDELKARLPETYRDAMKGNNGGEATIAEHDWVFYPIKDTSDEKRTSRTCNHIIHETKECLGFPNFPDNAVAIADNGFGDKIIFLKEGKAFKDSVYIWKHETGEVELLLKDFSEVKNNS